MLMIITILPSVILTIIWCECQFKENKSYFRVNEKKGIHSSIGEKLATILGNLYLILVYYRLHHPHA